jgi:hypothetical protein
MSSVGPTKEELAVLLNSRDPLHTDDIVTTQGAFYNTVAYISCLEKLRQFSLYAGGLCIASKTPDGFVTRKQVIDFIEMAMTLLTPDQKANLSKLSNCGSQSVVSQETYFLLPCIYATVKGWCPLP